MAANAPIPDALSAAASAEPQPSQSGSPMQPGFDLAERHYRVRLARDGAEVQRALRLRYEVFNLELGEGLDASHAIGLDSDRYDEPCHHLLLLDERTGEVAGTYRLQTLEMARSGSGFYCDQEFQLEGLTQDVLANSVELGRACIGPRHRMGHALFALWRGLAAYLVATGKRYLFGCCSLTSQDERLGLDALAYLEQQGKLHPEWRVQPRPAFACAGEPSPPERIEGFELPHLFGTYLRYGALVCGPPAIDRDFKTIDFLVLFDLVKLDPRLRRLFFDAS